MSDNMRAMSSDEGLIFRTGNTRIIVMENFEALGRYTAASEKAIEFVHQRNGHLEAIKHAMDRTLGGGSSSYIAAPLNVPKVQELLNQAAEAEQNMLTAVTEANLHAEACNKPKLRLLQQN